MIYLIKIFTYVFIGALIYLIGGSQTVRLRYALGKQSLSHKGNIKISWTNIIILSVLMGWYSTIVSGPTFYYDRSNYAFRFTNYWKNFWTWGLNRIGDFVHLYSNDPNDLFFVVTFLCTFLTLAAYRISREGKREALLFIVCSNYLIYSFYLCKQAPAIAMSAIAIALLLKKRYILSALFTLGAILFHESAFILIPLYGLLLFSRKKRLRIIAYIAMALSVFIFSGLTRLSSHMISNYLPDLYEQADSYLEHIILGKGASLVTVIKGIPYYFITLYGFFRRKTLKPIIPSYDQYLTMCVCASMGSILSFFMYWMWRLGAYCYFPIFVFASELYAVNPHRREAKSFLLITSGSLAFFTLRYLYQMFFWHGGF